MKVLHAIFRDGGADSFSRTVSHGFCQFLQGFPFLYQHGLHLTQHWGSWMMLHFVSCQQLRSISIIVDNIFSPRLSDLTVQLVLPSGKCLGFHQRLWLKLVCCYLFDKLEVGQMYVVPCPSVSVFRELAPQGSDFFVLLFTLKSTKHTTDITGKK